MIRAAANSKPQADLNLNAHLYNYYSEDGSNNMKDFDQDDESSIDQVVQDDDGNLYIQDQDGRLVKYLDGGI
jgi:hypothetical protein